MHRFSRRVPSNRALTLSAVVRLGLAGDEEHPGPKLPLALDPRFNRSYGTLEEFFSWLRRRSSVGQRTNVPAARMMATKHGIVYL